MGQFEVTNQEINSLFSSADIQLLEQFEELKVRVDVMKKERNEKLKELFKRGNIKSFENENLKITYIPETTKKIVDTARLKEDGLYESYLKDSQVTDSVRITLKYE